MKSRDESDFWDGTTICGAESADGRGRPFRLLKEASRNLTGVARLG